MGDAPSEFAPASLTECYVCGAALPPVGRGGARFYCTDRCCKRRIELGMSRPMASALARFEQRYVVEPSGCWRWTGPINDSGYGRFSVPGRPRAKRLVRAHRWSYEHFVEPIPDDMQIDHLCRNRACVNPAHMEVVSLVENVRRGDSPTMINARKTHCKHGHPLSGDNVRYHANGRWRTCVTCHRLRLREAHRRRKAAEVTA